MAYKINNVIDVSNVIQAIPPDRKSFGFGLIIGSDTNGDDTVSQAFLDLPSVAATYGSNSEITKMARTYFSNGWYGKVAKVYVLNLSAATLSNPTSLQTVVQNALVSSQDWYIALPTKDINTDSCLVIAGQIEASDISRVGFYTYSKSDALNANATTDLASQMLALKYNRAWVQYEEVDSSTNSLYYVTAAVAALAATVDFTESRPSITLANKNLVGVKALDLDPTAYSVLEAKNYNFFTQTTEINTQMIRNAKMASGQFFDTIQNSDWFAYNQKYDLLYRLQNTGKIPYTEDGFSYLRSIVEGTCNRAVRAGIIGTGVDTNGDTIENGYRISFPEMRDIPPADKASRILRNVSVTLLFSGAIHSVVITNDIQI